MSEILKEMRHYLHAAQTDPNLSHQRGYLPILERYKDYMSPDEAREFHEVKTRIEYEMNLSRGIVRKRMYG